MELVLGVDGGQSSTRTLLATPEGEVLGGHRSGPANHIHEPGGLERQYRALHEGYLGAFAAAGLEPREVACAYLGITGSGDLATARRAIPSRRLVLRGDIHTAFAGALPAGVGIIVIAGTGSIAYGCDPTGACGRSGGWGYFAGDEGSGYDIARHAFRAAFGAFDGRTRPTRLGELLLRHYRCDDLQALHRAVYAGDLSRDRLASAASLVALAARDGDEVALEILAQAGRDLADLVGSLIGRLAFEADAPLPLVPIGGVFGSGDGLLGPLLRRLHERHPRVRLEPPRLPPAQGALLLALRELGRPVDAATLERLGRSEGL